MPAAEPSTSVEAEPFYLFFEFFGVTAPAPKLRSVPPQQENIVIYKDFRVPFRQLCTRRGTIEVLNPNAESGGGPFARGRVKASAMGVWRTPNEGEYADPEGLVGRKVRVYFDGDCTYFDAKVRSVRFGRIDA